MKNEAETPQNRLTNRLFKTMKMKYFKKFIRIIISPLIFSFVLVIAIVGCFKITFDFVVSGSIKK